MFRLNSPHRADMATAMAIPLLIEGGWSAMTMRSLGRAAKISGPAVAAWYGSAERLHEVVASRYGLRWLDLMSLQLARRPTHDQTPGDVLTALVPADEDEIAYTRVWLTIQEAGRTEPRVGAAVAHTESQERWMLAARVDEHAEEVMTVLRGLRAAVCAPAEPLSLEDARAVAQVIGAALSVQLRR